MRRIKRIQRSDYAIDQITLVDEAGEVVLPGLIAARAFEATRVFAQPTQDNPNGEYMGLTDVHIDARFQPLPPQLDTPAKHTHFFADKQLRIACISDRDLRGNGVVRFLWSGACEHSVRRTA